MPPMAPPFEAHEMQPPNSPSSSRSGQDQRDQCWKDVEAETGFSTYASFLESSPDEGGLYKNLMDDLRCGSNFDGGEVFVLDILKNGSLSMNLRLQEKETPATRPTQLLQCLQSPPEDIPARVVLWSILDPGFPSAAMIDALGLGLKIDPPFFETVLSTVGLVFRWRSSRLKDPSIGDSKSRYLKVGDSLATVARNYRSEGSVPPVLLVVEAVINPKDRIKKVRKMAYDLVKDIWNEGSGGSLSFHRSPVDKPAPSSLASMSSSQYLSLLDMYFQRIPVINVEEDVLLLVPLVPLLHLEVLRLRASCEIVQNALLQVQIGVEEVLEDSKSSMREIYDELDIQRFWLRRRLETLEESRKRFLKFVPLEDAAKWLQSNTYLKEDEEIKETVADARAIDAEARDYMQLQIGNLSILESRKSIQLSNQQIKEAKRVKIFTILAFIYVPINLATSVFGMNLQQLNQNGQSLWSFFVTAIVALLVTGLMWFCLEEYNIIKEWRHEQDEYLCWVDLKYRRSIILRVAIFLRLLGRYRWVDPRLVSV